MADDVKQVKVDNWGIYFLQRLKHFFNRTDYCDLTLQFQDNAQLKVHRLVLSACTEYFELLERTCEMYEDCLVMPDDLQADIVVPIVNFMYTGQLEFKMDILDKLHQCSEIMNMPVLTKLLDSHRPKPKVTQCYSGVKQAPKHLEGVKETIKSISATEMVTTSTNNKRSHKKAFEKTTVYRDKKVYLPINKPTVISNGGRVYRAPSPIPLDERFHKKVFSSDPRPTRYELPEELDSENLFENSFCNISYTSQPLMVHPETRKQYAKRPKLGNEASSSKKFTSTTVDIVDHKPSKMHEDALFEDSVVDENVMFPQSGQYMSIKSESSRDSSQLFDQILDDEKDETKVTIETKNDKSTGNLDHAKIISEVLKKYPHLVKSKKNIKLKILNTSNKNVKKQKPSPPIPDRQIKTEKSSDYTYETDVLDSKQAAKLIALGAENIEGPWICLICGAPGKALNFTSYYKFRRHLVTVHNEKPVLNICEYCGQKSSKRNYIMHHMYTKHGVEPPPQYHFPKCNLCSYIALTEALLVKHKASHVESNNFRCNVCPAAFNSSALLLMHIQRTGHKYSAERKSNLQCIYCQKVFMRESNLCAHLQTHHKKEAISDGIIDDIDEELKEKRVIKTEPNLNDQNDFEDMDIQYQIQQRPGGNITVVTKKIQEPASGMKQKILNTGLSSQTLTHKPKTQKSPTPSSSVQTQNDYIHEIHMSGQNETHEEIVVIDDNEYIMRDNQLIPRRSKAVTGEFILSEHGFESVTPTTSMEFTSIQNANVGDNVQHANIVLKDPENITQSIPIYVSNEEEYKAIMTSNQPIIFDSGNSSKTLTVLSAPHSSTLETTAIDLDTSQTNDMMIIQDEYPLNVSEAVASENSNIVVVYSHEVGNPNKQYQLLTSQALGAQFVQSSSIITQNYETITTTTPVVNIQDQQTWQNNLQQIVNTEQIEITPVPTLQSIVQQTDQVQVTSNIDSNNVICDLPQVQMSSNVIETTNCNLNIDPPTQDIIAEQEPIAETLNEHIEENCPDNSQNISSMEIIEDGPIEESTDNTQNIISSIEEVHNIATEQTVDNAQIMTSIEIFSEGPIEETVDGTQGTINAMEVVQEVRLEEVADPTKQTDITVVNITESEVVSSKSDTTTADEEFIESQTYTQPAPIDSQTDTNTETIVENIEEINEHHHSEVLPEEQQITTQVECIQKDSEVKIVSDPNNISDVPTNTEQILTEDGNQNEQTLASEWSEEDGQEDIPAEATNDNNETQTNEIQANSEATELEESIENIQQEVDKQMAAAAVERENEDEINELENTSQDEMENSQETAVADPVVTQEKITSLLNDWEDNDSQESAVAAVENITSEPDEVDKSPAETVDTESSDKQDKIKSLVSDWDEDDEENKE